MATIITMNCAECKRKNYTTTKGKKANEKIEKKKFCRSCRKHTVHKEGKK